MRKMRRLTALALALLLLAGCQKAETPPAGDGDGNTQTGDQTATGANTNNTTVIIPEDMFSNRDYKTDYDTSKNATVTLKGTAIQSDTNAVQISGATARIVEEGTYILSGALTDGQIVVDAEKTDKIQLVLSGVDITSATSAPIYIKQADKVFITTAEGTENTLTNGGSFVAVDDNNIDATIFSKDDLTLNGEGNLTVISPAGHGIVTKDDLVITGGNYTVSSANQAVSGKQSVRIAGGVFDLTAGKDGIHAEDEEDTAAGFVYISGGVFTVSAEGDGISASGSLQIDGGDFIITAGGGSVNGSQANSGNYGGFMGGGMGYPGRPGSASANQSATTTDESTSMKALKATGNLTVTGGSFTVDSADDAVHSNANVTVSGGSFQIATGDDGFHADEKLTVSAGTIGITKSYEGLEGLHILISGGDISLVASDDGLNAAGGNDNSGEGGRDQMFPGGKGGFGGMSSGNGSIVISGGKLYIQASGDGIDANGTLEITGGYTVVCGPTQGDTATLDYDKTAVISGGTFIGTGAAGMAQSFSDSENQGVLAIRANAAAETQITIKDSKGNILISYAPALSCNVVIISSPDIQKGETYTITVGTQSGSFAAN